MWAIVSTIPTGTAHCLSAVWYIGHNSSIEILSQFEWCVLTITVCHYQLASNKLFHGCIHTSDGQIQYMPLHRNLQRPWQQNVHIQQLHSQCKNISVQNSSILFDCWPPHHIKSLQRKQANAVEAAPALGAAATDQSKYGFDPVALWTTSRSPRPLPQPSARHVDGRFGICGWGMGKERGIVLSYCFFSWAYFAMGPWNQQHAPSKNGRPIRIAAYGHFGCHRIAAQQYNQYT